MNHLGENHHVARRLHDLIVAVVGGVHHRRSGARHDEAAIVELIALRRVPTAAQPLGRLGALGGPLLSLGRQRRQLPVLRIHDQRGAQVLRERRLAPVQPELLKS